MENQNNSVLTNKLSIYEAIRAGFKLTFAHFFLLFKALLTVIAPFGLLTLIIFLLKTFRPSLIELYPETMNLLSGFIALFIMIGFVAVLFYTIVSYIGYLKLNFDIYDKNSGNLKTLFAYKHLFFRFVGLHLLLSFAVLPVIALLGAIGFKAAFGGSISMIDNALFVLCIVLLPFLIYIGFRCYFAPYAIVDKNLTIMESLRYSWRLTETNKWRFLGLIFVMSFISKIAEVTYVGWIIVIPAAVLITIYAYRRLQTINMPQ